LDLKKALALINVLNKPTKIKTLEPIIEKYGKIPLLVLPHVPVLISVELPSP
jgi:hypothetical protein